MPSDNWSLIRELFDELSALSADERKSRLAELASTDAQVAREVSDLLDTEDTDDGAVTGAVQSMATHLAEARVQQVVNKRIGQYRVTQHIAQGGMGDVYLAKRDDGAFEQQVAIKLLRASFHAEEDSRRFAAERHMLAKLDHPNIAKIYDGGSTEDGVAYLAMEYVDGKAIDNYCSDTQLSLRERLKLFQKVCGAIDYAHRNLIVHRDIKPSNILVAASGEPKLLDFGIAKLLDGSTENPDGDVTELEHRALTPDFASPEQVLGQPITTTSDVYSLGILLYLLTTGQRPYSTAGLRASEREALICTTEPDKPSVSAQHTLSQRSSTGSFKLEPSRLQGDLDAIVLTALHKEPSSRYASALELSRELDRYLANEPVQARGRHWNYLARKFVRRNALPVAVSLSVLGASVAGALYHNATLTAERDRAKIEANKAKEIATFLTDIFKTPSPRASGISVTAKEVVDAGAAKLETTLLDQPEIRASLFKTIGDVYSGLGQYEESIEKHKAAIELYRQGNDKSGLGTSLTELGNTYRQLREFDTSIEYLEEAAAVSQSVKNASYQEKAGPLLGLANTHMQQSNVKESKQFALEVGKILESSGASDPFFESAVETLVGQALHFEGKHDEAERLFRSALKTVREMHPTPNHTTAVQLNQLASVLRDKGELEEAEPLYLEALEVDTNALGPDHPGLDSIMSGIGWLYREMGRNDDAKNYLTQALDHSTRTRGRRTFDTGYNMHNLAKLLAATNQFADAEELYVETLDIYSEAIDPANPFIASTLVAYSNLLLKTDRPDKALGHATHALEVAQNALSEDHWLVGDALYVFGAANADLGHAQAAEEPMRKGFLISLESRPEHPSTIDMGNRLVAFYQTQGLDKEAGKFQTMVDELPTGAK